MDRELHAVGSRGDHVAEPVDLGPASRRLGDEENDGVALWSFQPARPRKWVGASMEVSPARVAMLLPIERNRDRSAVPLNLPGGVGYECDWSRVRLNYSVDQDGHLHTQIRQF